MDPNSATVSGKRAQRAREYETTYILEPSIDPEEAERISARVTDAITRLGGKLLRVDNWGKRRMAYLVRGFPRGVYVYTKYIGFDATVAEIERNLRMLDPVMRFLSIQLNDEVDAVDAIAVDPEEIKFRRHEATTDEAEPDLETRLGLNDDSRREEFKSSRNQAPEAAVADEGEPATETDATATTTEETTTEKA